MRRLTSDVTTAGAWTGFVNIWVSPVVRVPLIGEGVTGELLVIVAEVEVGMLVLEKGVAVGLGEAEDRAFSHSFATDSTYIPISETTLSTFDDFERVKQ